MGARLRHKVEDFHARGGTKDDIHRLHLALRRGSPSEPFQWIAVRGIRLRIKEAPDLKFFTYRDDLVIFAVEQTTGVTVEVGPTVPLVRGWLRAKIIRDGAESLMEDCRQSLAEAGNPPRPVVKLKTQQ